MAKSGRRVEANSETTSRKLSSSIKLERSWRRLAAMRAEKCSFSWLSGSFGANSKNKMGWVNEELWEITSLCGGRDFSIFFSIIIFKIRTKLTNSDLIIKQKNLKFFKIRHIFKISTYKPVVLKLFLWFLAFIINDSLMIYKKNYSKKDLNKDRTFFTMNYYSSTFFSLWWFIYLK